MRPLRLPKSTTTSISNATSYREMTTKQNAKLHSMNVRTRLTAPINGMLPALQPVNSLPILNARLEWYTASGRTLEV